MSPRHTRHLAAALQQDLHLRPELAGPTTWSALGQATVEARICTAADAASRRHALQRALRPVLIAVHEAGHAVAHLQGERDLGARLLRLEWYGPGHAARPALGVDAATLAESIPCAHPSLTRAALFAVLAGPHVVPAVFPRAAAAGLVPTEEWGPDLDFAVEIQKMMWGFFQDARALRKSVLRRIRGEAFVRAVLPVARAFLDCYPNGTLEGEQVRALCRRAGRRVAT
ncbi:hypothetical protein [Deinococcus aestuarii]|uniref:hypothetical protein n=1 Tax=Deinococcus aestuarii TaxID=2774531 RepID=UPI001C0BC6DF|nr:hypothetical protein [Deinococcus aestuarii]